jgi:hypothetical protein
MKKPPFHQKSYVCIEVFRGERPVLLVDREDGDWCFLCGQEHPEDAAFFRVVGMGHVLENDPSLERVMDLEPDWEAERTTMEGGWIRRMSSVSRR